MTFRILALLLFLIIVSGCNRIENGESLSLKDIQRIKSLGLLSDNEKVVKFYSEYKNSVAGNFYTNKRMAKYWVDESNSAKNTLSSAYYSDIKTIDTVYYAGATYSPYMLVTKTDGTSFKVCAGGKKEELRSFFEGSLLIWRQKGVKN